MIDISHEQKNELFELLTKLVKMLPLYEAALKAAEARYQFEDDHTIDKEKIVIEAEAEYAKFREGR